MQLNHLHLTVKDVAATWQFLQKYFGLRPLKGAKEIKENPGFAVLFDDKGLVLTLFRADKKHRGRIS